MATLKNKKRAARKNSKRPAPKFAKKTNQKSFKRTVKKTKPAAAENDGSASEKIDARIKELKDWRGEMLAQLRALILETDAGVIEEWKWMGVPVWSLDGIICTGETYKAVVKLTFMKGAQLKDPSKLFNSSLEGNARRAIDFREGDKINKSAFQALIGEAIALNSAKN